MTGKLDVDFGLAARDYAQHRPGFPAAFFDHVKGLGVGLPGQRIVDLGTGTGTLARGFAERGCDVVGLDPSPEMLAEATKAAALEGATVSWVQGWAESTGLPNGAFDVVCAGQCWHWFDGPRAAKEAARLLRAGGRILLAYFSYLPLPGSMAAATEELVLRHNPTWMWAGHEGPRRGRGRRPRERPTRTRQQLLRIPRLWSSVRSRGARRAARGGAERRASPLTAVTRTSASPAW